MIVGVCHDALPEKRYIVCDLQQERQSFTILNKFRQELLQTLSRVLQTVSIIFSIFFFVLYKRGIGWYVINIRAWKKTRWTLKLKQCFHTFFHMFFLNFLTLRLNYWGKIFHRIISEKNCRYLNQASTLGVPLFKFLIHARNFHFATIKIFWVISKKNLEKFQTPQIIKS